MIIVVETVCVFDRMSTDRLKEYLPFTHSLSGQHFCAAAVNLFIIAGLQWWSLFFYKKILF
jgi:hypothetical protein